MAKFLIADKVKTLEFLSFLVSQGIVVSRPSEVYTYLIDHPDVLEALPSTLAAAQDEFSQDAQLSLELYPDPEIEDSYLTLYVRQEEYTKHILERINALRAEIIKQLQQRGPILITTDFDDPIPSSASNMGSANPLRLVWGKWPGDESIEEILSTLQTQTLDTSPSGNRVYLGTPRFGMERCPDCDDTLAIQTHDGKERYWCLSCNERVMSEIPQTSESELRQARLMNIPTRGFCVSANLEGATTQGYKHSYDPEEFEPPVL